MISLDSFLDFKELQQIQDMFSDSTGLAAIAVDAQGNYITEGSNFTDFCMKYTRGNTEGLRRCVKCDNECSGTYFCHAGLMDFSTDLMIGEEKVGAIIGGQVLPAPPNQDAFREMARELGINEEAYIAALEKVPVRDEKTIRSAAQMLGSVVNQLVNLKYIEWVNSDRTAIINQESDRLVSSIQRIVGQINELQKIATMEQILAINASVEAARAGQAGVAFSVLAQEIGELSKNAGALYEGIGEAAQTMKGSMQQISKYTVHS